MRPGRLASRNRPDPSERGGSGAVVGDAHHLVRLFANLLDNAARHTPAEGQITVSAYTEGDAVVARVADTGEGIARSTCPTFSSASTVSMRHARAHGGTGLGLKPSAKPSSRRTAAPRHPQHARGGHRRGRDAAPGGGSFPGRSARAGGPERRRAGAQFARS